MADIIRKYQRLRELSRIEADVPRISGCLRFLHKKTFEDYRKTEMDAEKKLKIDLELPFANKRIAEIVYDVLRVDGEPKRSGVIKVLSLENTIVKATFTASLARQLRVALNNFFEKVDLITETIEVMGPPISDTYDYY